jgi:hypothetical protein
MYKVALVRPFKVGSRGVIMEALNRKAVYMELDYA